MKGSEQTSCLFGDLSCLVSYKKNSQQLFQDAKGNEVHIRWVSG